MTSYSKRIQFYKTSTPLFNLREGTHIIEDSIIPGLEETLLTHIGYHRPLKGPDDVRNLSDVEIADQYEKLKEGKYCELQVVCHPTKEHVTNPQAEVSLMNYFIGFFIRNAQRFVLIANGKSR